MPPSSVRNPSAACRSPIRSATEAAAFVLLLLAVAASAAAAQPELGVDPQRVVGAPAGRPLAGAQLEQATQALTAVMRCPVCQGLSVADSPVDSALAMREETRALLAAGYTEDQVLDYFERSYGEFVRLVPKREGFNWAVWIAPVAGFAAGLALFVWRMRRGRRAPPEKEVGDDLAPYLERVRREVSG